MTYPFVPAHSDLGPARGPRRALVIHMAEGGGTVGYLSRPNPNGVAVHFVIEYSGRIVQMLPLDHMQASIRPTQIRTTDDDPFTWAGVPITYGATAARAVLGDWARVGSTLGPNHASIGVEIEGFAKDGPNGDQVAAMVRLYVDMANRFPGIRSLAHRDFADYKACPGHKIPWDRVGGHGPEGVDTVSIYASKPAAGTFSIPAGKAVQAYRPVADGWAVAKTWTAQPTASSARYDATLGRLSGTTSPSSLLHVANGALAGLYVSTADVVETPDPVTPPAPDASPFTQADIDAAIAADRAKARITWEA